MRNHVTWTENKTRENALKITSSVMARGFQSSRISRTIIAVLLQNGWKT